MNGGISRGESGSFSSWFPLMIGVRLRVSGFAFCVAEWLQRVHSFESSDSRFGSSWVCSDAFYFYVHFIIFICVSCFLFVTVCDLNVLRSCHKAS